MAKHLHVLGQKGNIPSIGASGSKARPVRIARVPVFHEGTFRALLLTALHGLRYFRYRGRFWQPVEVRRGFALYRQAPDWLACLQQRVEEYEFFVYSQLLYGHCGRDGILRPCTHLRRGSNGAYRQGDDTEGEQP